MALPPFDSQKILLSRARRHLAEFRGIFLQYARTRPFTQFFGPPDLEGYRLLTMQVTQPAPLELAGIAFDIINNLRSALDHAVYDAARISGDDEPPRDTKFPFGKTEADALANLHPKVRSKLNAETIEWIFALEPWDGGKSGLRELNAIRNQKIHRILETAFSTHEGIDIPYSDGGSLQIAEILNRYDESTGIYEVARLRAAGVISFTPAFCVSIANLPSQHPHAKDAQDVFEEFIEIVNSAIDGIETRSRAS